MDSRELTIEPVTYQRLTLEQLASTVGLHPELVERFVDYGLLERIEVEQQTIWFDVAAVSRLRTIQRLREDLGINLPGIAVVLELLQRIAALQRELQDLRR